MSQNGKRARAWGLTCWTATDVAGLFSRYSTGDSGLQYLLSGKELCPDTNKEHWHLLLYFNNPVRFGTLKNYLVWDTEPHIEHVRDLKRYIQYCKKDGAVTEMGKQPAQGKRSDLEGFYSAIEDGKDDYELFESHPMIMARYGRLSQRYRTAKLRHTCRGQRWTEVRVSVYWGKPGVGKTRRAYDECDDLYVLSLGDGQTLWWDGYRGQKGILLDDFDGQAIQFRFLLRLLDGYPMSLPVKGSFTYKAWSHVYITSNVEPQQWYPSQDYAPLERRIQVVEKLE